MGSRRPRDPEPDSGSRAELERIDRKAGAIAPGPVPMTRLVAETTRERLDLLREADAIMMDALADYDLMHVVWQCPTVMLPASAGGTPRRCGRRDPGAARGERRGHRCVDQAARHDRVGVGGASRPIASVFYCRMQLCNSLIHTSFRAAKTESGSYTVSLFYETDRHMTLEVL